MGMGIFSPAVVGKLFFAEQRQQSFQIIRIGIIRFIGKFRFFLMLQDGLLRQWMRNFLMPIAHRIREDGQRLSMRMLQMEQTMVKD